VDKHPCWSCSQSRCSSFGILLNFKGYYSISNNDEQVESIGEVEIKFGMVAPTKVVSSAGKQTISWNRTSHATSTAFPHHAGELADYAEYMVGLFAATDIHFHD